MSASSTPAHLIDQAREKARDVRDELNVTGGELNLVTTVLERAVPDQHKRGDVRKAIDQAGTATDKVERAKEELDEVEALLAQEVAQRERLEKELARRSRQEGGTLTGTGESTTK